jgi:hypothetical protein
MARSPYTRFKKPGQRAKPRKLEEPLHIQIVDYLELAYGNRQDVLFLHVPNGGSRHPAEAAKLKRMGTKAGVFDLLIFRGIFPHWLEVKFGDNDLSDTQKGHLLVVERLGHRWAVCWTFDEAKVIIDGWLK